MRIIILIFLLLTAPTARAERVTVATYNVLNLFDVFDNPYTQDEGTDPKPRVDLERVAAVIRQLDADIVGLQEIENEQTLEAMVQEYLPEMGYDHVAAPPSNDGRGITLGVISRKPIVKVTSYRWQTIPHAGQSRHHRFARDLMRATIQATPDTTLDVFVVHFKSKSSRPGDPQSTSWRTAEAVRSRDIIGAWVHREPDALGVLMGDFNSRPNEPAASAVFAPVDGKPVLFDVLADTPISQRITYPSSRYPDSAIDYIAVTPALLPRLVPGSAQVLPQNQFTKGSDHLPVIAAFDLP